MSRSDLVLIIDDDPTVLNVTQQIVMRIGFSTAVADSGAEGVRVLEDRRDEVECVLLDMSMPGMDGAETFQALQEVRPDLPVILISGFPEDDLRDHFNGHRPFAFLQKPFSISDVDAALRRATAGSKPAERPLARERLPFARPLPAT